MKENKVERKVDWDKIMIRVWKIGRIALKVGRMIWRIWMMIEGM